MRHKVIRAAAALSGVVAFTAMSMVIPSGSPASLAHADTGSSAVMVTKNIIVDGVSQTQPMTLTVSQTTNLAPRQSLTVSWTGAIPSHNYSLIADPATTLSQTEYPMVLMQCWGSDATGQLDPSHCETGMYLNQYKKIVYNNTNTKDTQNSPNVWEQQPKNPRGVGKELKFQAVDGTWYNMWDSSNSSNSIPSELAYGGIPLNARGEWSDANGSRSNVVFEARSFNQYPASGCSDTQACTLVAVPITNPACVPNLPPTDYCHSGPWNPVGPGAGQLGNAYLEPSTWWLQTNWRNRLSVPLSFVKQNACSVTDQRPSVQIAGSQVASMAMSYYWDPAFCLDPTRFKLQYIQQSESSARQFFTTQGPGGYANNAILTSLPVTGSPRPVVHAPVLAGGFAISFLIDDGNNVQVTQLHLTPLLLAKLITQSYEARSYEPALQGHPQNIFADPEFLAINPGLSVSPQSLVDGTSLIMPYPTQTDTIWALTSYINSDPEARAWLDGQPDAYSGMVVNPAFRNYSLPQLATAIKDTWPDPTQYTHAGTNGSTADAGPDWLCTKNSIPAYFSLYSQGVQGLDDAATALLNLQSPAQEVCDSSNGPTSGQFQKGGREIVGTRSMFALTSTAQAAAYQFPTAQLQVHQLKNGTRLWAAPTTTSMSAALAYSVQDQATGVLSLDYPSLGPAAYPGTMPVYAAIPTAGLSKSDAKNYAQFLTFAATDGQTPGVGQGNLPPGYAPLPQVLRDYTLLAAQHVAAQDGVVPAPPPNLSGTIRAQNNLPPPYNGGNTGLTNGGTNTPSGTPSNAAAPNSTNKPTNGAGPHNNGPGVTTVAETRGTNSWLAAWGLPVLLGIGLLAGVGVPLVRAAAQPGHPLRTFFRGTGTWVADRFRRRVA